MSWPLARSCRLLACLLLLLLLLAQGGRSQSEEVALHIGGLFPISGTSGWQGGQAGLPAAKMALDDVNKAPNLLTGYRLVLHWNDSEVGVTGVISRTFPHSLSDWRSHAVQPRTRVVRSL